LNHAPFLENQMKAFIVPAIAAITLALSAPVLAQTDHSMHGLPMAQSSAVKDAPSAVDAALGEGLVKKVDIAKGTVTLQHGALPNGMPPMTMAYKVKDVTMLDKVQVGQKIRFATDPADGGMTVTRIVLIK
jgi:Cu/Ag efflux protein CusF